MEHLDQDGPRRPSRYHRLCRYTLIAAICLSVLVVLVLLVRFALVPLLVVLAPPLETTFFELGVYGPYVERRYKSFDLPSPALKSVRTSSQCNSGLVMLTLGGPGVHIHAPMILDAQGELVWTTDEFEATANLKVQQYQGQDHLTFWAGKRLQESGIGYYYVLNSTYQIVQTVAAVGESLYGDLHEFKITDQDTGLIIAYNDTTLDTPAQRPGWVEGEVIIDGIFQEIDIATGKLIFQWRASDYLEHPAFHATEGGYVADGALDYFHVNSVDKDFYGNYLISIRHLHTVVYVDGKDGHILWALGGQASDFKDVSGTEATTFKWQHDACWVDREQGLLSVFDNGIARGHYSDADVSQGLVLRLDSEKRTVNLEQAFKSPTQIRTVSQGSVQKLPPSEDGDTHFFVGWGASAAYSEFNSKGEILCETHFAASSLFYWERAKSYRAIKAPLDWRAEPSDWDPVVKFSGDKLFVSWNGANDVAMWRLEGHLADTSPNKFEHVKLAPKQGFETVIEIPADAPAYSTYRVTALDSRLRKMRYSNVEEAPKRSKKVLISCAVLIGIAAAVVAILARHRDAVEKKFAHWRPKIAYHKLDEVT